MTHNLYIISILIIIYYLEVTFCKTFNNYTLYRGVPANDDQFRFLNTLSQYQVNYWQYPGRLNMSVDFLVPPQHKDALLRSATDHNLQLVTLIQDIQTEFDKQTVKQYIRRRMDSFDWNDYYRLKDIYTWMRDLGKAHPEQMKVYSIGKTYQKREILAARVSIQPLKNRPIVIVEGGIHAREWISPAVVTYFLHRVLTSQSSKDTDLKTMAVKYEWYFVPVLNGDGYEYSHTKNRIWRKNRRRSGVDLNRNFDVGFGTVGVSFSEDSDIYCGARAFSEPESKAMADFISTKGKRLLYYLAFHSYGQHIIMPYAHLKNHVLNFDEMKRIADEAKRKISRRYGTQYTTGTAYDTVGYTTSGVSGCWVKKKFGTPYVATFELRDTGASGFALPSSQILPTCRETLDGLVSMLTYRKTMKDFANVTTDTANVTKDTANVTKETSVLPSGQDCTSLRTVLFVSNMFLLFIV